ncbi:20293_t:CDS:1 [Cetraspora pellucida]|uniref:20293_t:CDS:1 n=1 Tax=Cetraspora pellucida TaxID=1433469 RepID=A0A9N8VXN5_9GLOM|nr:20293_t:CDS:1 [Cetraspora pellucida]
MESKSSFFKILVIACSVFLACSMVLASPLVDRDYQCSDICVGQCDNCAFVSSDCTGPLCNVLLYGAGTCGSTCLMHCGACNFVCTGCTGSPPLCPTCSRTC